MIFAKTFICKNCLTKATIIINNICVYLTMSQLVKNQVFIYYWYCNTKNNEECELRAYALTQKNNTVCLHIRDFYPKVYIELPTIIVGQPMIWDSSNVMFVINHINHKRIGVPFINITFCERARLYGEQKYNEQTGEKTFFKYPYLCVECRSIADIKKLKWQLNKSMLVAGIGELKFNLHELEADPILQFTSTKNIPTSGWVKFTGLRVADQNKISHASVEYSVNCNNILQVPNFDVLPRAKLMSFDMEVYSKNQTQMPDHAKAEDCIFMISCVVSRQGSTDNKDFQNYLITLGEPKLTNDIQVIKCNTEVELIMAFRDLVNQIRPNILMGYNIFDFDLDYLIGRTKYYHCLDEFSNIGYNKYEKAEEKIISWSSSAYKKREYHYLDMEGIVMVDMLPLVQTNFKLNSYSLKNVSSHFLEETKDPLSAQGIFTCYKEGIKQEFSESTGKYEYTTQARNYMGICGKYCVQDSALVIKLFEKLMMWPGLTEMAKICNVPIITLYTHGQQIKVYSQIYKYCFENKIVAQCNGIQTCTGEALVGAYVYTPTPGYYTNVVPFDFSSLYPSIIIAYNIDFCTFVREDSNIPDELCHVMEWEEHNGCQHDQKIITLLQLTKELTMHTAIIKTMRANKKTKTKGIYTQDEINKYVDSLKPCRKQISEIKKGLPKKVRCNKYRYRFLKEPMGALPTVLVNLINARKAVRARISDNKKLIQSGTLSEEEMISLRFVNDVLEQRQLAIKVSCNSGYGALGTLKGYLPFMPGAMCVTYMGRTNIDKAANLISSQFKGKLIYGDTDSNYVTFPDIIDIKELWEYSEQVAAKVSTYFPRPIVIEFECKIYKDFFILTKKRYMYIAYNSKLQAETTIGKKGVLLARRDNSKYVRDVYNQTILSIFAKMSFSEICSKLLIQIFGLFYQTIDTENLVITKAVGDAKSDQIETAESRIFVDYEKGETLKTLIGAYKVPALSYNADERQKQLKKKNVTTEYDYYMHCLPAHVQLAHKMGHRGIRVPTGTRLGYVILDNPEHEAKQYEKIEDYNYYTINRQFLKIDCLYYLKNLSTSIDQMLNVAYKLDSNFVENFTSKQYKYCLAKYRMLQEFRLVTNSARFQTIQ